MGPVARPLRHPGHVQPVIDRVSEQVTKTDPGGVLGLYLFGSSVTGGLRPSSDIDLLLVTERSLSLEERQGLVRFLLQFSGRRATVEPGRPLELTSVVLADVAPWVYPPTCDFLYGEWLRTEFVEGAVPEPHVNPDLAVLVTTLQQHAKVLRGAHPADLLPRVPAADLRRSVHDSLMPLLEDLVGDERNVLLTLARMLVTLESGEIVSKDEAVRRILPVMPEPHRTLMSLAVSGYLGRVRDNWSALQVEAQETAAYLASRIQATA
jgi:predicted nucleotidyltransferase